MITPEIEEEVLVQTLVDELIKPSSVLILYNDDHNTFSHVIECLRIYCDHSSGQAEQCALLVHHKGECDIKHGEYTKLKPIYEILLKEGLTVKIKE